MIYLFSNGLPEVLLVHPEGPFWVNRDLCAWSIPKGAFEAGEDPLDAAIRETEEETGLKVNGPFIELMPVKQNSGKTIYAWAVQADFKTASLRSNLFEMEWPPKAGIIKAFPEIDRAGWFPINTAHKKIIAGQVPLLAALVHHLKAGN